MEKGMRDSQKEAGLPRGNLSDLVEEVRLTSLNLAIASSKFKALNDHQDQIKKSLTEVVALALESVHMLSQFLSAVGFATQDQSSGLTDVEQEKLDNNLKAITEYVKKISENYLRDRGRYPS